MILSTAYLGNIQYFSKLASVENIYMETNENYIKQSYRNRCEIMTTSGVSSLVIPVVVNHGAKTPITDVRIDYAMPWQKQHMRTLISAYKNSPYFDHYEDLFIPFYEKKEKFLFDYNMNITNMICETININPNITQTKEFRLECDDDFRFSISPKDRMRRPDDNFIVREYYQVFSDKYPFAPNLSIVDLLFCEGPQSVCFLK